MFKTGLFPFFLAYFLLCECECQCENECIYNISLYVCHITCIWYIAYKMVYPYMKHVYKNVNFRVLYPMGWRWNVLAICRRTCEYVCESACVCVCVFYANTIYWKWILILFYCTFRCRWNNNNAEMTKKKNKSIENALWAYA